MSVLNLLLETDMQKLELKFSKEFEVKRLSKIIGSPFIVKCSPLTNEQLAHISEISKTNTDLKVNTVLECCKIDGKKIASKELMEKFKAPTPKDLVEKLFLPGEIYSLYSTIDSMSGYGEGVIEEIKNS